MDLHLKQWSRKQHQNEQPCAKIPKLLLDNPHHQQHQLQKHPSGSSSATALPLFLPEPHNTNLSAVLPDSTSKFTSKIFMTNYLFGVLVLSPFSFFHPSPSCFLVGILGSNCFFSLAQWQELELQALIYRYMLAGVSVPPQLLQPIKKSLNLFQPYSLQSHYHPACKSDRYYLMHAHKDFFTN